MDSKQIAQSLLRKDDDASVRNAERGDAAPGNELLVDAGVDAGVDACVVTVDSVIIFIILSTNFLYSYTVSINAMLRTMQ